MLDTTSLVGNVSFLLVFLAGIASFFSPCVVPLLPAYLSYLSGSDTLGEYKTKKVLLNTIAFVLGISVTFFLLGFAFTNIAHFFTSNQNIITKISGIAVIVFGLVQIDFIEFKFLNRERRIKTNISKKTVNPVMAFLMGLTFSFAWTPCVGPMLSSILLLASSAKSMVLGNVLVTVYTLGFILPFVLAGIFTTKLLNLFKKHKNVIKYVKKIGGAILIIIGIMMFTGWLNNISGYLNTTTDTETETISDTQVSVESKIDFTLKDQNGTSHTLLDYEGKVVFINFWATGCPPCQGEIPHIIDLYEENTNENVVILTIVNPNGFLESDTAYILSYMEEKGITFPVLFDETGEVFNNYGISSIPTTYMITAKSEVFGYINGAISRSMMDNIILQTLKNDELD